MIILLSPSKTINPKTPSLTITPSQPQFLEQSEKLVARVNKLGRNLARTLGVSEKIAEENKARFLAWSPKPSGAEASLAAWTYRGETYAGLAIDQLDQKTLTFAQQHVLIVSGLYGLLRPQDQIMPYRLEMSTRLKVGKHKNLYDFWGSTLADHIVSQDSSFILNCASNEYTKAVVKHLPKDLTVITPTFLHDGKSKMAFAKYMRGAMARWACENKITDPSQIIEFDAEGYTYDADLSGPSTPVFKAPKDFTLKGRWTKL